MGYGLIYLPQDRVLRYIECGVFEPPSSKDRTNRLREMWRDLIVVIREHQPDAMAMEQHFVGKFPTAALALGEARGLVISAATVARCPLSSYPPAKVKAGVGAGGGGSKKAVANLVRAILGLKVTPEEDATDALAVAITYARNH